MGGRSKPPPPQTVTQTSKVELSPEQRRLFEIGLPQVEQFAKTPLRLFPGSQIAGFTPEQVAAQQLALGVIPQATGLAQSAAGASNFLTSGNVLFPQTNPALAAAAEGAVRPLFQQLTESVLPNLRSGAVAAGQFGGSRQGIAEGLAVGRTAQTAGDITSQMFNQGFQAGLQALVRGLALTPQTISAQLLPAQIAEAVGTQKRGLEQARLSEEASRFNLQQVLPFLQARDIIGLATGLPGGTATTQVTGASPTLPSPLATGIGGAASGAAIGLQLSGGNPIGGALGAIGGFLATRI